MGSVTDRDFFGFSLGPITLLWPGSMSPLLLFMSGDLQYCWDQGGYLTELFTAQEEGALDQILLDGGQYWLGLSDTALEGEGEGGGDQLEILYNYNGAICIFYQKFYQKTLISTNPIPLYLID